MTDPAVPKFSAPAPSAFARKVATSCKPRRTVVIPPIVFADSYLSRPKTEVAAGIRLLSEAQIHNARAEAARVAVEATTDRDGGVTDMEARTDAYNDTLIRAGIAASLCDPNDTRVPFFEFAEHVVRTALTSEGARWLWDAITRAHVELAPATPAATDDDVLEAARRLDGGAIGRLPAHEQRHARKMVTHLLERLRTVEVDEPEPAPLLGEGGDGGDEVVHVIRASVGG